MATASAVQAGLPLWPSVGSALPFSRPADRARVRRGQLAALSGAMAEDTVARQLQAGGLRIVARRWRGKAGEIDLICRDGDCVVFVEVKQSATHAQAAQRLGAAQQARLCNAACEYVGGLPTGQLTEMRFDVALVDALGRVEMLQNAFGESFA